MSSEGNSEVTLHSFYHISFSTNESLNNPHSSKGNLAPPLEVRRYLIVSGYSLKLSNGVFIFKISSYMLVMKNKSKLCSHFIKTLQNFKSTLLSLTVLQRIKLT